MKFGQYYTFTALINIIIIRLKQIREFVCIQFQILKMKTHWRLIVDMYRVGNDDKLSKRQSQAIELSNNIEYLIKEFRDDTRA